MKVKRSYIEEMVAEMQGDDVSIGMNVLNQFMPDIEADLELPEVKTLVAQYGEYIRDAVEFATWSIDEFRKIADFIGYIVLARS